MIVNFINANTNKCIKQLNLDSVPCIGTTVMYFNRAFRVSKVTFDIIKIEYNLYLTKYAAHNNKG